MHGYKRGVAAGMTETEVHAPLGMSAAASRDTHACRNLRKVWQGCSGYFSAHTVFDGCGHRYAARADELLRDDATSIFELIGPSDRIVVRSERDDMRPIVPVHTETGAEDFHTAVRDVTRPQGRRVRLDLTRRIPCVERADGVFKGREEDGFRFERDDKDGAVRAGDAADVAGNVRADAPIGLRAAASPYLVFAPSNGHRHFRSSPLHSVNSMSIIGRCDESTRSVIECLCDRTDRSGGSEAVCGRTMGIILVTHELMEMITLSWRNPHRRIPRSDDWRLRDARHQLRRPTRCSRWRIMPSWGHKNAPPALSNTPSGRRMGGCASMHHYPTALLCRKV